MGEQSKNADSDNFGHLPQHRTGNIFIISALNFERTYKDFRGKLEARRH